ncbi:unnamed protein product [Rhizophagus irregularis]|nr:unnamed protein product [Rhizophagus irregularis]
MKGLLDDASNLVWLYGSIEGWLLCQESKTLRVGLNAINHAFTGLLVNYYKMVRLSGDFRSTRNPKIRSALRFGSQVTSEKWKSKEFVQLSGDFRRMEIQRIRSALRFGSQVTSEEWKSKEFVRLSGSVGF